MIIAPLTACSMFGSSGETNLKTTQAETVFEATLTQPLNENEILYLEMLDEVTGLALNPTRYEMEAKDDYSYYVRIPLAKGSIIKYRYVRQSGDTSIIEHDTSGTMVQYRISVIRKAAVVSDMIAGWDESTYAGFTGEVSGYIYDEDSEIPLSEIMVYINGIQASTSSNGYYEIKNIPLGEFNLVALHPDGDYVAFQQAAELAENSVTPASFGMEPADMVEVTFEVMPPESETTSGDIRLISNIYSLGNTFSENAGGVSVLSSQAPILELQNDGKYEITLELPEGFDFQYKYSLGDGFVNAEHSEDGSFKVRQLIVPKKDTKIKNTIQSWYSTGNTPKTFNVTVPQYTFENDVVAIQFNPYVWMEPIPMKEVGGNEWSFTLYSPQEYLSNAQFRFCRNYQCGLADDASTSGENATGYQLDLSDSSANSIDYSLETWIGLSSLEYAFSPISIPADNNIYIKGIEIDNDFDKKDFATYEWGVIDTAVNGANLLVISPSWTFPLSVSNKISLQTGSDLLFEDLDQISESVIESGLTVGLYPQPRYNSTSSNYWSSSDRSYNWWEDWFDKYQLFILHYADYAELNGIQTLIIGGSQVAPAFPQGNLPDGKPSNTPYDFEDKWNGLIANIRSKFSGQLFFALPYSDSLDESPDFLVNVDAIYVELSSAISTSGNPGVDDIKSRFSQMLDNEIYKLYAYYQKPVIIVLDYLSVDGSASNCLDISDSCQAYAAAQDSAFVSIDEDEQAYIYQAVIEESIQRNWIYGIISQGYNPSVLVRDNSSSVRGKKASLVLAHYYNSISR